MMPNIFKLSAALFLLTFCVNYAKAKTNPDIFSIIDENTLQRKLEFTFNDSLKSLDTIQNGTKLLQYLSLVSDEMNELDQIEEQKFKEDPIPLPSSYIELSPDEVKFHEISFDDFGNIKKAPVRLETIIPDGSDPNTIKIIYESKVSEIVLSGLAEMNGVNCDFVLNITDFTLREEHEKAPAPVGKIVTKSILETITFKKFTMLIVQAEGNKFIKSPNKQILRKLADSWLVHVVNAVNNRFVQPKIMEQTQFYFKNFKNAFLEAICSSLSTKFNSFSSISSFVDRNLVSEDSEYDSYTFTDITFGNFSNFSNCSKGLFSVQIEKNGCPNDNYYSHDLTFAFTYSSKKFAHPFLNWTLVKYKEENRDRYNNFQSPSKQRDEKLTAIVRYWSIKLVIFTDKNGRKTDNDVKVEVDFDLENGSPARLNNLADRVLKTLETTMATSLQNQIKSLLTSPVESTLL